MIGRPELVAIINTCFDAVNASKAGPIHVEQADGTMQLQSLGYQTFLYVVSKLMPCSVEGNFTTTTEEGIEVVKAV